VHKIEIAQQAIDISLHRRDAAPLFATIEPLKTARDAAMRNSKTVMISDANASRNEAEHNATLSSFLQAFGGVLSNDEAIKLIFQGMRS
jgi:nicotinamidase-related amidase